MAETTEQPAAETTQPEKLGRFAQRKPRAKQPTPTPLQAQLDAITSRLNPAMRVGCLKEIEAVRLALNGSTEKTLTAAIAERDSAIVERDQVRNENRNQAGRLSTFDTNTLHVRAAIEELPEKPKAKDLHAAIKLIAGLVGATVPGDHDEE